MPRYGGKGSYGGRSNFGHSRRRHRGQQILTPERFECRKKCTKIAGIILCVLGIAAIAAAVALIVIDGEIFFYYLAILGGVMLLLGLLFACIGFCVKPPSIQPMPVATEVPQYGFAGPMTATTHQSGVFATQPQPMAYPSTYGQPAMNSYGNHHNPSVHGYPPNSGLPQPY